MLKLPKLLIQLIEEGVWPGEGEEPNKQEFDPIVKEDKVKLISDIDTKIVLMPPPFWTITEEQNPFYTEDITCFGQIDYDKAICIADFGLGSDSPIILYYQEQIEPVVMYLKWQFEGSDAMQEWVQTHSSFEEFASTIGIT